MSAFMVTENHINTLLNAALQFNSRISHVTYGEKYEKVTYQNAQKIGRAMIAQNAKSVMYRYPGSDITDLPGPNKTPLAQNFVHRLYFGGPLNPLQILKMITMYEYQACENPGWESCDVKDFCQSLRMAAIYHLPGYEEVKGSVD